MSASEFKYVRYGQRGFGDRLALVGRAVAYLGVPASLFTGPVFSSITILTSFYLIAAVGIGAALRGTRMPSGLIALAYLLLGWYVILLALDLYHGGPGSYPLFGTNYLLNYFVLPALPFFALGLRALKAEIRWFEYAMMATIVIATGTTAYQVVVLHDFRPKGFNSNPIPFALIVMMWSLFLLARALAAARPDWLRLSFALLGLVPIVISGSRLVWVVTVIGYASLAVWWAWSNRRWRTLGFAAVATVVAFAVLYQFDFVQARTSLLLREVAAVFGAGDTSGPSFGLRLSAAKSGLLAFLHNPFAGYGLPEVKAAALEWRSAGSGDFTVLDHLHNEYVTHLVAFGILGGLFMVSLFAAYFTAATRVSDTGVRRFAIVGGVMVLLYMAGEVVFRDGELYGLFCFIFGLILLSADRDEVRLPAWMAATSTGGTTTAAAGSAKTRSPLPPVPVLGLIVATLIGAGLFVWAQRDSFVLVAQKGVLAESPPASAPAGAANNEVDASVTWRAETGAEGPRIVASLDIPETGQRITLTFRRNTDAALPASHLIEVVASPQRNFPDKTITGVGVLVAKGTPGEAGLPLTAATAEIGNGVFWIGLGADDIAGNRRLLADAAFFDLPFTYASGQQATLTFEKGRTGVPVFEEAMTGW